MILIKSEPLKGPQSESTGNETPNRKRNGKRIW